MAEIKLARCENADPPLRLKEMGPLCCISHRTAVNCELMDTGTRLLRGALEKDQMQGSKTTLFDKHEQCATFFTEQKRKRMWKD